MTDYTSKSAIVADGHELYGIALGELLRRTFKFRCVIVVTSVREALDQLARIPDVGLVSLELLMPGIGGPEGLQSIRDTYPHIPLVIVTASEQRNHILQCLDVGVNGYVLKSFRRAEMVAALAHVLAGAISIPSSLALKAPCTPADASAAAKVSARLAALSRQQQNILRLIALGKSNKEIARELQLAEGTVKVHVNALYRRLGVNNRVNAVAAVAQSAAAERPALPL